MAEFGIKKSGHEGQFGRDKQEKATDVLRSGYEKITGYVSFLDLILANETNKLEATRSIPSTPTK